MIIQEGECVIILSKEVNCPPNLQADHDVIFIPKVLKNSINNMYYDDNVNNALYTDNIGTVNAYKVAEINNNGCTSPASAIPTSTSDYFFDGATYLFPYPSPVTLIAAPLKEAYGSTLAGYDLVNSESDFLSKNEGIKQTYHLDKNIDLTVIRPAEQTIYNPSEVFLTSGASDLIFPEHYTFKTIHGTLNNITATVNENISENGGPYNDLRDVPVTTDLTSENPDDATNFPLSAQAATQHLYASSYYLDDGSKLTVSNCVRLLDATFDIKQGAKLWCSDYPSVVGKEDHSFDRINTRFKFQTLGGAVLRNGSPIQYLQNGIITQSIPLHYTATDEIQAGNTVETDTDVLQNDYSVESTGDVTLDAANTIFLKDGFRAKNGCNFRAFTAPQGSSVTCPPFMRNSSGNRIINSHDVIQSALNSSYHSALQVIPNPSKDFIEISHSQGLLVANKIQVMNAIGKVVFEKQPFNSMKDKINLSNEPDGIYIALVFNNKSVESVKFVLQK